MTAQAEHIAYTIPPDQRIWWFRIIADLCANGYTYQSIAVSVGVGLSTVRDWKGGARPKFEDGDRLINLWCQVTKNLRETVPTISRYSHLA